MFLFRFTWSFLLTLLASQTGMAAVFPSMALHPMADDVYDQEVGSQVPSAFPLTSIAVLGTNIYAGSERGLFQLEGTNWTEITPTNALVRQLLVVNQELWVSTSAGLLCWNGSWKTVSEQPVTAMSRHAGGIAVAQGQRVGQMTGKRWDEIDWLTNSFPVSHLVSHQDLLFVQGADRLTTLNGTSFGGRDEYGFPTDECWDWGALPSRQIRDIASIGPRLVLATDRGLGVVRGMSLTTVRGEQGLPFEDVHCLCPGEHGDLWIGTSRGVIRQTGATFQYFSGKRWLPGEQVNGIAVSGKTIYFATDGGLGVIQYEPYTLAKKAAYYEREIVEWGHNRLGLIQKLEWDDTLHEYVRESGDNDGGYSGDYLVAESYRFAVTHEPEAHALATNTFHALRWLRTMTGIPGFVARGMWVNGERGHKATGGSGGYPAEWNPVSGGQFEWKGDTSSDELCSHFYSITRFRELAAQGAEGRQAKEHLLSIASHLIEHGWQLIDLDGKPTRWGRWDPEYFKTDEGHFDRGLQCLELLSFIKTAAALTPNPYFAEAYQKLVNLGYPGHVLRQRKTFPPDSVAHFEDQLAFWCYWNLLRYEQDPKLSALYRRSFERTYEMVRVEQQPWYNFLHAVISGEDEEAAASIAHLREWPLDLRVWSYQNSHRADLRTPSGYQTFLGGIRPFSPREREPMRWDAWTMQADGGSDGRDVVEPSSWLLAYWMGRYHGLIAAPTTTDPAALTVQHSLHPELGAKPYSGPPRPGDF